FLFVGWFWYLGTLVPVIGLIQVGTQAMADRYTYLPSVGIAIMFFWGIFALIKNERIRRKILLPGILIVLIIMSVLTWRQCGYWKDSIMLFNHALRMTKENYIAHNHLASALVKKRKLDRAIYHYNEAILINPHYTHAYYNRGIAYYLYGKNQLALGDFIKAISMTSNDHEKAAIYNNIGVVYTDLGRYQNAIENYNHAILLKPDDMDAWGNRAFVYLSMGDA
ncbi:MAG: tetratricopeptide repeat protein, partial [Smithella sp.]